mmetsp:Transcript_6171/g.14183  ORF Transcript_6171/g.14183 Transcript_6171/m.14183 type:complete len:174 (+) Transcript_6171:166-687(+)
MAEGGLVVGLVSEFDEVGDKLKALVIDVGEGAPIKVVTNAPNVGSRTVGKKVIVAKVGTEVDGEKVSKRTVGGVTSEGMLMDSKSMGWSGGAAGNAVLVPDSLAPGDPAPSSRPRMDNEASTEVPTSSIAADKKAEKEAKKAAAKAAREAKKAAKSKTNGSDENNSGAAESEG